MSTFTLPALPFEPTALTPFCSKETFEYHHGKHHAAYVAKLNDALKDSPLADLPLEELIRQTGREGNKAVYNNAAQHFNHSFFWNCLSPTPSTPGLKILELINRDFGSLAKFQEEFTKAATTLFGSGWVWLAMNAENKLTISQHKDADNPLTVNQKPLLTLDVWEHSYYIDFRNRRPDYIAAFWQFVNWPQVEKQLA